MARNRLSSAAPHGELPSERSFGLLFAIVCAIAAGYGRYRGSPAPAVFGFAAASLAFLLAAFAAPLLLRPLNRAWFAFGLLLSRVVSPLVLGAIYFLLLTPVAVVTRAFGRDELRLKPRERATRWIAREPAGPPPGSFHNQF